MTSATNDPSAEYAAALQRQRNKLAAAKSTLLAALRRTRAAFVRVAYDGEGDSGQIGDIKASSVRHRPVKLTGTVILDLDDGVPPRLKRGLRDALAEFTWSVLRLY